MRRIYLIIGVVLGILLPMSCGQKYAAEQLVEEFIEQNASVPEAFAQRYVEHFDSTRNISDSMIMAFRRQPMVNFRHPVPYPTDAVSGKLFLLRMRFEHHGDTTWHTFYIDEEMKHIVAFK